MTEVSSLQAALGAEEATIYGYGVVGARLQGANRDYATNALQAHQEIRDQLITMISSLGAAPVAAAPAYQLPFVVNNPTTARALAAHLEQGVSGALWDLIATTDPASAPRAAAIAWLSSAAVRALHWGASQALPGQPD